MKRNGILLALLLALLLAGCGKEDPSAPTAPAAAEPTPPTQSAEPAPEVENNGGYYVRVGDTVYFRRYGRDALPHTATFGEFTGVWGVSGASELMAYVPASGELNALYTETGSGPLWYADGGFYLCEYNSGEARTVWFAPDGSGSETLCPGIPVGVTDSGLLAVEQSDSSTSYDTVYTFYRNKEPVGEWHADLFMTVVGLADEGLFLLSSDYTYEPPAATHVLWQLTPEGTILRLGEITDDEVNIFADIQPDRFLVSGGKVTVGLGYYAGTGHFLNDALFVQAEIGRADSLSILPPPESPAEETLPYPVANAEGGIDYVEALPGTLRIGGEHYDTPEVWEDGAWQPLSEHLIRDRSDGWGFSQHVQHMDYVDGAAYITLASDFASPADGIGWRDAFTLLSMSYLRAERGTDAPRELTRVERGAELYGNVWFIEGADVALWQQLTSEDGEGWFDVPYAFAVPIEPDADWDDLAFDGVTGLLPFDYGEDEADYFGYPVPDAEPAGLLTLVLNGEGSVTALLRKDPDAVMDISFDVPEAETEGAVETFPLVNRESDEDTPRFWTLLTSLEDGLHVRLERTPAVTDGIEELAMQNGLFIVGETLFDGTLDRGAFLAVRASLPWHPELRVSVFRNGRCGSYIFGEDNALHLETEYGIHPEMTLAAYAQPDPTDYGGDGLYQSLLGSWEYRSPDTGALTALLSVNDDLSVSLERADGEGAFWLQAALDRIYAEEWEAPDLLCLRSEHPAVTEALGFGGSVGDYAMEFFRTDGMELLRLTQANNGDGALGMLLPQADGTPRYDLVFSRASGAGDVGARRYGAEFTAEVARYDPDALVCWLREAAVADSDEALGEIWRAKKSAPCLAYPVTREAAAVLRGTFPMALCRVTTDGDGAITALSLMR